MHANTQLKDTVVELVPGGERSLAHLSDGELLIATRRRRCGVPEEGVPEEGVPEEAKKGVEFGRYQRRREPRTATCRFRFSAASGLGGKISPAV